MTKEIKIATGVATGCPDNIADMISRGELSTPSQVMKAVTKEYIESYKLAGTTLPEAEKLVSELLPLIQSAIKELKNLVHVTQRVPAELPASCLAIILTTNETAVYIRNSTGDNTSLYYKSNFGVHAGIYVPANFNDVDIEYTIRKYNFNASKAYINNVISCLKTEAHQLSTSPYGNWVPTSKGALNFVTGESLNRYEAKYKNLFSANPNFLSASSRQEETKKGDH